MISCIFDWVSETSRKNEKDRLILHFYSIYKQQFLGTLKSFENHAGILKIMNVSDENRNEGTTFMKARRTNNWLRGLGCFDRSVFQSDRENVFLLVTSRN